MATFVLNHFLQRLQFGIIENLNQHTACTNRQERSGLELCKIKCKVSCTACCMFRNMKIYILRDKPLCSIFVIVARLTTSSSTQVA